MNRPGKRLFALNPERNTTCRPQKHGVSVVFRSGIVRSGFPRVWGERPNAPRGLDRGLDPVFGTPFRPRKDGENGILQTGSFNRSYSQRAVAARPGLERGWACGCPRNFKTQTAQVGGVGFRAKGVTFLALPGQAGADGPDAFAFGPLALVFAGLLSMRLDRCFRGAGIF